MTLGDAAQVAAAHCLNEQTLDPAVCRPTHAPASLTMAVTPQCSPATTHYTIFSSEYYQILIAAHLPTAEGWKAELATLSFELLHWSKTTTTHYNYYSQFSFFQPIIVKLLQVRQTKVNLTHH